jgi:hypothetical protein
MLLIKCSILLGSLQFMMDYAILEAYDDAVLMFQNKDQLKRLEITKLKRKSEMFD